MKDTLQKFFFQTQQPQSAEMLSSKICLHCGKHKQLVQATWLCIYATDSRVFKLWASYGPN